MIIQFIQTCWPDILCVLGFIGVIGILLKFGKYNTVKQLILALVVQAERALGSGTGELKYAVVVEAIYTKLPFIIRTLYTSKEIDTMIEDAVTQLKQLLADGVNLLDYSEELLISDIKDEH